MENAKEYMANKFRSALQEIADLEVGLAAHADEIRDAFWEDKKRLQADQKARLNALSPSAKSVTKGKDSTYAPLYLSTRLRGGSLELYWRLALQTKRGGTHYKYIRKGGPKEPAYNLTTLLPNAKSWERELIRETERRAAALRAVWTDLQQTKQRLRNLATKYDKAAFHMDIESPPATPQDVPPDPRIAPEPRQTSRVRSFQRLTGGAKRAK